MAFRGQRQLLHNPNDLQRLEQNPIVYTQGNLPGVNIHFVAQDHANGRLASPSPVLSLAVTQSSSEKRMTDSISVCRSVCMAQAAVDFITSPGAVMPSIYTVTFTLFNYQAPSFCFPHITV